MRPPSVWLRATLLLLLDTFPPALEVERSLTCALVFCLSIQRECLAPTVCQGYANQMVAHIHQHVSVVAVFEFASVLQLPNHDAGMHSHPVGELDYPVLIKEGFHSENEAV
jgi:hypothetical protein